MLTVRLGSEFNELLNELAQATGRSKSHYVRKAVQEFLEDRADYLLAISLLEKREPGHPSLKPLSGFRGVQEIRLDHETDAYRLVYVVNLPDAIYVLHVFKKKSSSGISTPQREINAIQARLKRAKESSGEKR